MIITQQKPFEWILDVLKDDRSVFLVGCGECAATCHTGGEPEILAMKEKLENAGKTVTGWMIPDAPCIAAQTKTGIAKNIKALKESDTILVLACGSGVQSVKENDRFGKNIHPACDTLFGAVVDAKGNFLEVCSACGECVLELTGGICPITRCAKGLLNGPCGGMDKGKCEVDKDSDCAWVLIYNELCKKGKLDLFKIIQGPKDFSKTVKPHKVVVG